MLWSVGLEKMAVEKPGKKRENEGPGPEIKTIAQLNSIARVEGHVG